MSYARHVYESRMGIIEEEEAQKKLTELLSERPKPKLIFGKTQIQIIRKLLVAGEYVDFWKAYQYCQKTQRLSAVIHVLRHKYGYPIVEWEPCEYGGSVYCLYKYAPALIKKRWRFISLLSASEIKDLDFKKVSLYFNEENTKSAEIK